MRVELRCAVNDLIRIRRANTPAIATASWPPMKFSIVTTVLNGASFIGATVASVLAQTHEDFDYVIVDAGSTDGTQDIVSALIRDDARATLKSAPGAGMYRAILDGLSQARGGMLAWINADDLYTPWAFGRVAAYCAVHDNAQWVTGLPAAWDDKGSLTMVRPQGAHPQRLIRDGWFHRDLLGFLQQESMFFSADLFARLTKEDLDHIASFRLAGDYALWRRFARHAPLETIPTVLGGFRRHAGNRSIAGMSDYMEEVRREGATFLPWPLTPLARRIYWLSAAEAARRAAAET